MNLTRKNFYSNEPSIPATAPEPSTSATTPGPPITSEFYPSTLPQLQIQLQFQLILDPTSTPEP